MQNKKQKKVLNFISNLVMVATALFFLDFKNVNAAADVIIYINPSSISIANGSDFSVDVMIDPKAHYVSNADLYFTYDQTKFTLSSITPSSTFSTILSSVDGGGNPSVPSPANGTGSYSAANMSSHLTTISKFATLNFHAIAAATNSPITISNTTMVYADNSPTYPSDAGFNVVGTRTGGTVTVTVDTTGPSFVINDGASSTATKSDTINITVSDPSGVATQNYGFSLDNVCNGSDTITTSFTGGTNFQIVGDHTDYLCVKAIDSSINSNVSYQLVGQLHTDNTGPTGGSITYANSFLQPKTSFSISVTDGSDTSAGINTANRILQRRSVTPIGGICGTFGSWSNLNTAAIFPYADSTIAEDMCYQYQTIISDSLGNQTTFSSSNVIKSSYRADLNIDGSVGGADFSLLHNDYGSTSVGDIADINIDNIVNGADFSILHNEYNKTF